MTDPTPEQIDVVRDAIEAKWPEIVCYWHPNRDEEGLKQHDVEELESWDIAEVALIAAAGVTPTESSRDRVMEIAEHLAKIRTFTLADGEAIARAAIALAPSACRTQRGDAERGDPYSCADLGHEECTGANETQAPVQVDEAKLTEVIRGVVDRRPYGDEIRHHIRGIENAVARSVAEWLRGGGR